MRVDFVKAQTARLWEGSEYGAELPELGKRAMFRKMNDNFLAALRLHHGRLPSAKPIPVAVPVAPVVVGKVISRPEKVPEPLAVGLLDDLDEAELVHVRSILRRESVRRIVDAISAQTGIQPARIVSRTRTKCVVAARHWAYYELNEAGFSLTQIGRMFQIDHTTALHGIRQHKARTGL